MKAGVKSTEFYLTIVAMILGVLKQFFLQDFPNEAFYTVIAYVLGRAGLKAAKK